jgi:hypothetical protein
MQAEGRRCGDIDIRRIGIVESNAEHLADLSRGDRRALRFVDPVLALRRLTRRAQIENAADCSLRVDHWGAIASRHHAGEPGCECFAGLQALSHAWAGGKCYQ